MPIDASITGTPLGAITGSVTNADDGTINGTIGYVATGTISSTVGVPGPQGPAGPAGPTGPQGPQGEPGAPGVGVPAGGSAGQVLAKVDGVDYNTEWINVDVTGYRSLTDFDFTNVADTKLTGFGMTLEPAVGTTTIYDSELGADTLAFRTDTSNGGTQEGEQNEVYVSASVSNVSGLRPAFSTRIQTWADVDGTITAYSGVGVTMDGTDGFRFTDWNGNRFISTMQYGREYITFGNGSNQTIAFPGFNNVALTGNPTAPTPATSDNDTSIATTAFVKAQGYATLASPVFTGDARAVTPSLADNDTSIATTAFVKAQGYLTSAPVTSVAGRTGAVTLSNTDISGLGTMATATATDYLSKAGNLAGLASASTSRNNLELGAANNVTFNAVGRSTGGNLSGETTRAYSLGINSTFGGNLSLSKYLYTDDGGDPAIVYLSDYKQADYTSSGIVIKNTTLDVSAVEQDGYQFRIGGEVNSGIYCTRWTAGVSDGYAITPDQLILNSAGVGYFLIEPATGITFPDATVQTTAAFNFDPTGYATESWVTSQGYLNDAPSDGSQYARRNAAWDVVITGDRYLTSSTTSNTIGNGTKSFTIGTGLSYTPTQNITISYDATHHMHGEVLTYNSGTGALTVDVNHHTGSGTYSAWVINVGGVTPATSVAWGGITGTLSAQTDLQSALDLKSNLASPTFTGTVTIPAGASISGFAPLASPTFTGTPSLPTGTTAVTQSAGNNTTAVATTAFVQQEVPDFATADQARGFTSTTTTVSPRNQLWAMLSRDVWQVLSSAMTATNVGTISYVQAGQLSRVVRPGTAGACSSRIRFFGQSQIDQVGNFNTRTTPGGFNFSLRSIHSGRSFIAGITQDQYSAAFYYGKAETDGVGNLVRRGYGWKLVGGAGSRFLELQVHNGTTLTSVTSSYAVTASVGFDWDIESDGAGNVTLYVNGSSVATSSAGPTGLSAVTAVVWQEEVVATSTLSNPFSDFFNSRGKFAVLNP